MGLIDYVINTPQNTNRTILKQLVNTEKNKAVYESVEELKREGSVGWVETKHLVNDGTKEPSDIFGDGSLFVHLTNEVIDLFGAVLTITDGKNTVQVPVINEWYESNDGLQIVFTDSEKEHIVALCIPIFDPEDGLEVGLYVRHTEKSKVTEVSYKIIHPIDLKYLPGGDIAEAIADKLAENGQIGRISRKETFIDEEVKDSIDFPEVYPGLQMIGTPFTDSVTQYPSKAVFIIDGVRHECEKRTMTQDGQEINYYGNLALVVLTGGIVPPGDYDTGEPFLFMQYTRGFMGYIIDPNLAPQHTVAFYEVKETITPSDSKYLPGACLPVVELTTQIPNDGSPVHFTTEECEAFNNAALSGMPAVIRFPFNPNGDMEMQFSCMACLVNIIDGGIKIFGYKIHADATTDFGIEGIGGVWAGRYMPTE